MFDFFKRQTPVEPPTDKQRRYAAKLGIEIPSTMSKQDVSAAISELESRNPSLTKQREKVKGKIRENQFGKEVITEETRWNQFADENGYILAIYTKGKETIVDVLRVNEAFIDARGKLKLGVEAPKLIKDRHIGDWLDWDKHFELPVASLLHYEPLHADFHDDGIPAYKAVIERGLAQARSM